MVAQCADTGLLHCTFAGGPSCDASVVCILRLRTVQPRQCMPVLPCRAGVARVSAIAVRSVPTSTAAANPCAQSTVWHQCAQSRDPISCRSKKTVFSLRRRPGLRCLNLSLRASSAHGRRSTSPRALARCLQSRSMLAIPAQGILSLWSRLQVSARRRRTGCFKSPRVRAHCACQSRSCQQVSVATWWQRQGTHFVASPCNALALGTRRRVLRGGRGARERLPSLHLSFSCSRCYRVARC